MRVLVITKLFPNRAQPLAAPFNRRQFAALARLCQLEVIAPLPWLPPAALLRSELRALARVPRRDVVDGVSVHHPRFLQIPRLARSSQYPLLHLALLPLVHKLGKFDAIVGSWAYPHGCAAVQLARQLRVPALVKVHGSDINVVAGISGPRRLLRRILPAADGVVAVSRALGEAVVRLGVPAQKIHIIRNGVDTALFRPRSRAAARAELGRDAGEQLVLYVGWLEPSKGILDLLSAFSRLAAVNSRAVLAVVGDGSAGDQVRSRAAGDQRIRALGALPPDQVATWMAACDLLVLPSWNEGTPNVILEALACGRRVVATAVGGIPDLLHKSELGTVVPPRDRAALTDALERALTTQYDPQQVASLAAIGDWNASAAALHSTLEALEARGLIRSSR